MTERHELLQALATCVDGYWSDLTRTVPVGKISAGQNELLSAVAEAQRAAMQLLVTGLTGHDVDAAARNMLKRSGFADYFTHATGHHIGFRYHDPGFSIAPESHDTLQAGMVITIEPGAYIPQYHCGARLEDNVAITAIGIDILSDSSGEHLNA